MKELLERAARADGFSQQDLHIILDALPVALSWATHPDGRIRFLNRAFRTTFGYGEEKFLTVDDWIECAYPRGDNREEARRRWHDLWQARSSGISEVDPFEIEVLCADGTTKAILHRGIVLHDMGVGIAIFDDVSDRRIAEETLRRFALEDPLTGLANRRMLQEKWAELSVGGDGSQGMMALLLVDLDGFKSINDRFGHDAGDQTLICVAERLRSSVRSNDLACRIGGDEFAILLPDIHTPDTVEQICWRIGTSLSLPIKLPE